MNSKSIPKRSNCGTGNSSYCLKIIFMFIDSNVIRLFLLIFFTCTKIQKFEIQILKMCKGVLIDETYLTNEMDNTLIEIKVTMLRW